MTITETAKAKVNLTLEVKGKRPDGYHELVSLVAFASYGDRLDFTPGANFSLEVSGPMAQAIDGTNLIEKAAETLKPHFLSAANGANGKNYGTGHFHLVKRIPVAAGLGGGSADAAAAIRALLKANPGHDLSDAALNGLAARLGADVPVCLAQKPALMSGIGERLLHLPKLEPLPAVLVNPGVRLATKDVFHALDAPSLSPDETDADAAERAILRALPSREAFELYLWASGNSLQTPAMKLAPVIGDVLAALRAARGCWLARLSGSGPTCFGLFESEALAQSAASALQEAWPDWWIVLTELG